MKQICKINITNPLVIESMKSMTIYKHEFCISTDKTKFDVDSIYEFLSQEAYWCHSIPREKVETSIQNSLCFGVFENEKQVGFARVVSDFSTIAYLGDVYILKADRGRGLAKWLLETIMNYPDLQGLRRWILLTADAHELYRQFGWSDIAEPHKWMELHNKNVYKK